MNGKILAIILVAAAGYYGYEIYKAKQSKVTPVVTPKPLTTQPCKFVVQFVPPPPPRIVPWATKGYWQMGCEGELLAIITPAMAYLRLTENVYPQMPEYVALWYKENYPELFHAY